MKRMHESARRRPAVSQKRAVHALCLVILLHFMPRGHARQAAQPPHARAGVFAGGQAMIHSAEFRFLAGYPSCCPQYTTGGGTAVIFGASVEFPTSGTIRHSVRASYGSYGGILTSVESIPVVVNGLLQTARIQHTLTTRVPALDIEPMIHADIGTRLGVFGGFRCSFLLDGTLEQYEELITPSTGTFENDSRIRNKRAGDIFALQPLTASVVAGIRTSLPLNASSSYILVPEISAAVGLTSMTGNEEWRVHSIRAGISLMHEWSMTKETARDSATLDLRCDLSVNDGQRDVAQGYLGLRTRERTDVVLPLPVIYFDDQSSALPDRWRYEPPETGGWIDNTSSPALAALTASHALLGIVGERMRMNEEEAVDIVGMTEAGTSDAVVKRRCETVAQVLEQSYGISRSRLFLRTTTAVASGWKEAASVRNGVVLAASPRLLGPVVGRSTERTWTPSILRIRPQPRGTDEVRDWEVRLEWRGRTLRVFRGTTSFPASFSVDMREVDAAVTEDDSLVVVVTATGMRNTRATTRESMPVRRQRDVRDSLLTVFQLVPRFAGSHASGGDAATAWTALMSAVADAPHAPCTLSATAYGNDTASRDFLIRLRGVSPCTVEERSAVGGPYLSTPFPESRLLSTSLLLRHLR